MSTLHKSHQTTPLTSVWTCKSIYTEVSLMLLRKLCFDSGVIHPPLFAISLFKQLLVVLYSHKAQIREKSIWLWNTIFLGFRIQFVKLVFHNGNTKSHPQLTIIKVDKLSQNNHCVLLQINQRQKRKKKKAMKNNELLRKNSGSLASYQEPQPSPSSTPPTW